MRGRVEGLVLVFFDESKLRAFGEKLEVNAGRKIPVGKFLERALMRGAALGLVALGFLSFLGADNLYITLGCAAGFAAPLFLSYFYQELLFERNKRGKEALIPDMLLQASAFPRGTSFTKIISYIAGANYGLLSREFEKALLEIRKGAAVPKALGRVKRRNKSRVIGRAVNLLIQGYESGADMGACFKEAADDMLATNAILRERNATMVVEKYTLLLAGGIIVPAVLGLLVGLVSGMDFSALGELEFGISAAERAALLGAAMLANQIYIAEYAVLASIFIANQEGNRKNALPYALFLLPFSFASYSIARGLLQA